MKRLINGQEIEAQVLAFSTVAESWNEYILEDGRTLRVKFVLTRVCGTEIKQPNGELMFLVDGLPVFIVDDAPNKRTNPAN